jgi:cyclic pyranopterin phosphate synthase
VSTAFSHLDASGHAVMVDVTEKPDTMRRAVARATVAGVGDLSRLQGGVERAFSEARAAGLLGAKQTSALIPLCHPLSLSNLDVELTLVGDDVAVVALVETLGPTGVEMEALTACTIAALTLLAALSPIARRARIEELCVWEKSGGKSGSWVRSAPGVGQLEHRS